MKIESFLIEQNVSLNYFFVAKANQQSNILSHPSNISFSPFSIDPHPFKALPTPAFSFIRGLNAALLINNVHEYTTNIR